MCKKVVTKVTRVTAASRELRENPLSKLLPEAESFKTVLSTAEYSRKSTDSVLSFTKEHQESNLTAKKAIFLIPLTQSSTYKKTMYFFYERRS